MLQSQLVKLAVTFPPEYDLEELTQSIESTYLFVLGVKRCGKNKLLLSFECMSDLLEVDMMERFGAIETKVRNSDSFCKEMGLIDEKQFQLPTEQTRSEEQLKQCISKIPLSLPLCERKTSLEDKVSEQQELQQKLDVLADREPLRLTLGFQNDLQESEEAEKQQRQATLQKTDWGCILGGLGMTCAVFGGLKLCRMLW